MGGFSFGSPSSTSHNSTQIANDSRTQDNRVAVQNADALVATGGGNYDTHAGAVTASRDLTINQVDPNSFGFASHLIDQVFGANATSLANARAGQQSATNALAGVAEAARAAAKPPAAGSSWQSWGKWGGIVAGAGVVVVLLIRALRNRRARHAA